MADEWTERAQRVLERLGIPEPYKTDALAYHEEGRERYGAYNFLNIPSGEYGEQKHCESCDLTAFETIWVVLRRQYALMQEGTPADQAFEEGFDALGLAAVCVDNGWEVG